MTQSTNLMTDIDKRFQVGDGFPAVRYISPDEMAYLRARAVALRGEAIHGAVSRIASLFRARPAEAWTGPAVTAK